MFIIKTFSTYFGHHYAHLQENKTCVTARGVMRWFCSMWLVAVVGRCVVGCEHCEGRTVTFTLLAPYNAAPHNRYQPHPAEPAQQTTCSNTRWFSLSLHNSKPLTSSNILFFTDILTINVDTYENGVSNLRAQRSFAQISFHGYAVYILQCMTSQYSLIRATFIQEVQILDEE